MEIIPLSREFRERVSAGQPIREAIDEGDFWRVMIGSHPFNSSRYSDIEVALRLGHIDSFVEQDKTPEELITLGAYTRGKLGEAIAESYSPKRARNYLKSVEDKLTTDATGLVLKSVPLGARDQLFYFHEEVSEDTKEGWRMPFSPFETSVALRSFGSVGRILSAHGIAIPGNEIFEWLGEHLPPEEENKRRVLSGITRDNTLLQAKRHFLDELNRLNNSEGLTGLLAMSRNRQARSFLSYLSDIAEHTKIIDRVINSRLTFINDTKGDVIGVMDPITGNPIYYGDTPRVEHHISVPGSSEAVSPLQRFQQTVVAQGGMPARPVRRVIPSVPKRVPPTAPPAPKVVVKQPEKPIKRRSPQQRTPERAIEIQRRMLVKAIADMDPSLINTVESVLAEVLNPYTKRIMTDQALNRFNINESDIRTHLIGLDAFKNQNQETERLGSLTVDQVAYILLRRRFRAQISQVNASRITTYIREEIARNRIQNRPPRPAPLENNTTIITKRTRLGRIGQLEEHKGNFKKLVGGVTNEVVATGRNKFTLDEIYQHFLVPTDKVFEYLETFPEICKMVRTQGFVSDIVTTYLSYMHRWGDDLPKNLRAGLMKTIGYRFVAEEIGKQEANPDGPESEYLKFIRETKEIREVLKRYDPAFRKNFNTIVEEVTDFDTMQFSASEIAYLFKISGNALSQQLEMYPDIKDAVDSGALDVRIVAYICYLERLGQRMDTQERTMLMRYSELMIGHKLRSGWLSPLPIP